MGFRVPVDGGVKTQGFGANPDFYKTIGQKGHNGVDWGVPLNKPVYAMDEGTVTFEGWGQNHSWMGSPAGICALINHVGSYGGYAHMNSTVISKGQKVVKGQLIGYAGATGTATGVHVHSEMLPLAPNFQNGYAGRIDITPYYENSPTQGGNSLMTPNFVRRAYWLIQGRDPSQGEVDFHVSKSNPESFINGFGDNPLWKTASEQRDQIITERNNLVAVRDGLITELNDAREKNLPLEEKILELGTLITSRDEEIERLKKTGGVDQETKDKINQTLDNTNWIKNLLDKIFRS
jgi:hypothetical protein